MTMAMASFFSRTFHLDRYRLLFYSEDLTSVEQISKLYSNWTPRLPMLIWPLYPQRCTAIVQASFGRDYWRERRDYEGVGAAKCMIKKVSNIIPTFPSCRNQEEICTCLFSKHPYMLVFRMHSVEYILFSFHKIWKWHSKIQDNIQGLFSLRVWGVIFYI